MLPLAPQLPRRCGVSEILPSNSEEQGGAVEHGKGDGLDGKHASFACRQSAREGGEKIVDTKLGDGVKEGKILSAFGDREHPSV